MISECGRESNVTRFRRFSLPGNHLLNSGNDLRTRDRVHAAEIERTFAQKTRAALDMMPKNAMALAERTGAQRFGRSENRHRGNPQQGREMHGPGIVSK